MANLCSSVQCPMKRLVYLVFHPNNLSFDITSFNREGLRVACATSHWKSSNHVIRSPSSQATSYVLLCRRNGHITSTCRFYFPNYIAMLVTETMKVPSEPACETLYRLYPSHLATQSPVFEAMLSLPQGGNEQTAEGRSDDNPIVLHGIVQRDFDHLLCYLFGR